MEPEILNQNQLLTGIDEAVDGLLELLEPLNGEEVNTVPFEGSWTPAQLFRHVTKSTNGVAYSLSKKTAPIARDPASKIAEIRKTFLDFSIKMESPEDIRPEDGPFDKLEAREKLLRSFARMKEALRGQDLNELVDDFPGDELSKLELLHFVLYHTQRHLHQLRGMVGKVKG